MSQSWVRWSAAAAVLLSIVGGVGSAVAAPTGNEQIAGPTLSNGKLWEATATGNLARPMFEYLGHQGQELIIPDGVQSVVIHAVGGGGGGDTEGRNQSSGAAVTGTVPVAAGDKVTVWVGGNGQDGRTLFWTGAPAQGGWGAHDTSGGNGRPVFSDVSWGDTSAGGGGATVVEVARGDNLIATFVAGGGGGCGVNGHRGAHAGLPDGQGTNLDKLPYAGDDPADPTGGGGGGGGVRRGHDGKFGAGGDAGASEITGQVTQQSTNTAGIKGKNGFANITWEHK